MKLLQPIFAQSVLPTEMIPGAWRWMGLSLKELLLLLGAFAAVSLCLFIWAVYFRKRPGQHSHRHHHHHSRSQPEPVTTSESSDSEPDGERRYRKKRRRRREHRPRNPTLAETGGLPPLRAERPADPLP
jgi:hypothetical protein